MILAKILDTCRNYFVTGVLATPSNLHRVIIYSILLACYNGYLEFLRIH
jgi:hypothetical protein